MRLVLALLLAALAHTSLAQGPVIAAAANVKFALDEIVEAFQRDTGQSVRVVYGSTGNLAQQITNGAPFQMLLSADEETVDRLVAAGLARDRGVVYAVGRLVLYVPPQSALKADEGLRDLRAAIADGRLKRLAIASPEHAPYGRAARQALERAGLWDALRPRLVIGENVAQAMQFAQGGDAQGGLVPLALVAAPQSGRSGTYALLPESMHEPLLQRMALLKPAGEAAVRFYEYVRGASARTILARHGYAVPSGPR